MKQARKLQATLVRNSAHRLTYSLTGVKCRATSVAKNMTLTTTKQQIFVMAMLMMITQEVLRKATPMTHSQRRTAGRAQVSCPKIILLIIIKLLERNRGVDPSSEIIPVSPELFPGVKRELSPRFGNGKSQGNYLYSLAFNIFHLYTVKRQNSACLESVFLSK